MIEPTPKLEKPSILPRGLFVLIQYA